MASDTTPNPPSYRIIGTRPIRHDGADKVTGRAKYGADYTFPGMLHGKVLRSPYAHARIKSINTEAARKLPGVFASLPAPTFRSLRDKTEDLGEGAVNSKYVSMNVLAREKAAV